MQDTVRKTMETAIAKSKMEVDFTMTTNIIDTIPWTNYREIFEKQEEQARAEGKAEGRVEGKIEVALNLKKLKTMTDKEIAKLTELSVSIVKKL
jgi:predicted transposase YdaD